MDETTTGRPHGGRDERRAARRLALGLSLVYAAVAAAWVVLSDRATDVTGTTKTLGGVSVVDLAFIFTTTAILFLLALWFVHRLRASHERSARIFENAVEGITIFRVVRDHEGTLTDLELADINPTQLARTGLRREEVVGRRLSRPDGLDERTRSYLEVVASAAGAGAPLRSELHVKGEGADELLAAYPVGRDRWALAALDITDVRHAERALRHEEESIRRAYVDVLDAVTGGKLILLTEEELGGQLGTPLGEARAIATPRDLASARRDIATTAGERFPDWAPRTDMRSPACEALANSLKHAGGGTYQVFATEDHLQVVVRDTGPGIDFRTLPNATLVPGFSTSSSLGMGFTLMLQSCERVLLSTRPGRTSVVLEFDAGNAGAPGGLENGALRAGCRS